MALWLDIKYARLCGGSIERFTIKKESPFLSIGRCSVCGDSKDNKLKRRFYFYQKDDVINCVCHNCGYSGHIVKYMKLKEPYFYRQYVIEKFGEREKPKREEFNFVPEKIQYTVKPKIDTTGLVLINNLPDDHPAKTYIKSRKIPSYPIYYVDKFCEFSSKYNSDFKTKKEHPRIIIPIFSRDGVFEAYQARSLNGEQPKYYTVAVNEDAIKIFGVDKVRADKTVYVVEGPIDSLYIPNAIAARSSAIIQCVEKCSAIINNNPKNDYVLIWDNEPRKPEIVEKIKNAISAGYSVVIWPQDWKYKDINEGIVDGKQPIDIYQMIKNNTYSGLIANLKFTHWKKI